MSAETEHVVVLDAPPSLLRLYAKAAASALGRGGDELPTSALTLGGVAIDPSNLAAYNRVCGFRLTDVLPPTYPHIVAFPLAAQLMTDRDFPFALPGLVHIANRITLHRTLTVADVLDVTVRLSNLRPHHRGRQFDIEATVAVGGATAWASVNTYLHREPAPAGAPQRGNAPDLPAESTATWRLPGDTGRRYAAVSGDRNPIHLSALSARLFGFPKAVAHGMWTKARCLAALQRDIAAPAEITVEFAKPVLLPTTVAFSVDRTDERIVFALRSRDGSGLHLHGRITS